MLAHILFVFLGVAAAAQPIATDCDPRSRFRVVQLDLDYKAPPLNSTLSIVYNVPAPVTDGVAQYSCIFNGFPVVNEVLSLCKDTVCPIVEGFHEDVTSFETGLSTGTLRCTNKWLATDGTVLRCIQIDDKASSNYKRNH